MSDNLVVRQLGLQPYERVFLAMQHFTEKRNTSTDDEIWLVQHPQVFTQGRSGQSKHLLMPGGIPVIQSDRGGQVTFHGPGQQIMYVLLDLRRRQLGIRSLVSLLEKTVIATLSYFAIAAHARTEAPGVYVGSSKICSLGLRVHKGCSFHGLALNVEMDLTPFLRINPCGYAGLHMTQVSDLSPGTSTANVTPILMTECLRLLNATAGGVIQSWNYDII